MIQLTYHTLSPNNWGDFIAPVICKYITGQESEHLPENNTYEGTSYAIIGSILSWLDNPRVIVWGCGFITKDGLLRKNIQIRAVRGRLTRDIILKQGCDCPEVYGDPVLLFPRYYNPNIRKTHRLGIIPHYIDKEVAWVKKIPDDVKIIDICGDSHGFIDEVLSCEMIASSALHGLVLADAYGIPNVWIKLSDNVGGDGFKFRDYFSSINKKEFCLDVDEGTSIKSVYDSIRKHEIEIDLDLFLKNCPIAITRD